MKQASGKTVENIDIKLRELFNLVGVHDERLMIRFFLDAIDLRIAWEVEKSNGATTSQDLDTIVGSATRQKMVMKKYKTKDVDYFGLATRTTRKGEGSSLSDRESLIQDVAQDTRSVESLSTIGDLLKEFRELKMSLVQFSDNRSNASRSSRTMTCFFCNKGINCPESFCTGVNTIPLSARKEQGFQL